MSPQHVAISPELHSLALDLSILGKSAERVCTGFSTEASIRRLITDLKAGKGQMHKLERALKARLASAVAAEKERARLQAAQHKPASRGQLVGA